MAYCGPVYPIAATRTVVEDNFAHVSSGPRFDEFSSEPRSAWAQSFPLPFRDGPLGKGICMLFQSGCAAMTPVPLSLHLRTIEFPTTPAFGYTLTARRGMMSSRSRGGRHPDGWGWKRPAPPGFAEQPSERKLPLGFVPSVMRPSCVSLSCVLAVKVTRRCRPEAL